MRGHLVHRKAGWDCHGLPVELEIERELGHQLEGRHRGATASRSSTQRCRESVLELHRRVEPAHRADRLLGRHGRRLLHARQRLHRVGLVVAQAGLEEGPALRGPQGRARTARAAARRCRRTRSRSATRTSSTRRCTCASRVRGERGRLAARLDDHAVDAALERRAGGAPGRRLRARAARRRDADPGRGAASSACSARTPRSSRAMKGSELAGTAYEPPFPYITDYGPRGHTVLEADFVTTEDGTGIVHTALAFGEDDFRLGEQYGLTVQNPVKPDGTFDERIGPFAGRCREGRRPGHRRGAARERPALPRRAVRARLPALLALRHAAPLLRQGELVRAHDRRAATSCSPTNEAINWHPEHIKHGRLGDWLEGNVDWALSRERYWGTPLPIWRCDEGHELLRSARCDELRALGGDAARRPAQALHRRRDLRLPRLRGRDAARARGDRRLVGLGLHAVRAVARAVRERGPVRAALPGGLHLRGARPDARLVLLAARDLDAAVRPVVATRRASASA